MYEYQADSTRVLFLESLAEVRRTSEPALMPVPGAWAYEVYLQLLVGPGYRQFEFYELRPYAVGPETAWRVVRYELQGVEYSEAFSGRSGPP